MPVFAVILVALPWTFFVSVMVAPVGMGAAFDQTLKGILLCSVMATLFRKEALEQWKSDRLLILIAAYGVLAVISNIFTSFPSAMQPNSTFLGIFGNPIRGDGAFWYLAVTIFLLAARANKVSSKILLSAAISNFVFLALVPSSIIHTQAVSLVIGAVLALQNRQWWLCLMFGTAVIALQDRSTMLMWVVGGIWVAVGMRQWLWLSIVITTMLLGYFVAPVIGFGRGDRVSQAGASTLAHRIEINQWGLWMLERGNYFLLGGGELASKKILLEYPHYPHILETEYSLKKQLPHSLKIISNEFGIPMWEIEFESGRTRTIDFDRAHNWFVDAWLQHGLVAVLVLLLQLWMKRQTPLWIVLFVFHGLLWFAFDYTIVYLMLSLVIINPAITQPLKSPVKQRLEQRRRQVASS
jgi:hypothetical protein